MRTGNQIKVDQEDDGGGHDPLKVVSITFFIVYIMAHHERNL